MLGQWLDRQIYWRARELSCQSAGEGANTSRHHSILTIISDGMDQSKFRVPRWEGIRVKALDKFPRPALHVTGCWAHGHALHLAVSNPDVPKDSNANIEVLARMLDTILLCNKSLPHHLHWQLDNSARENKNQKVFRFCMLLVNRGVFRSMSLHFLRKGHTHEDIDGLFGQLALEIARSTFDSIDQLIDILTRKLRTAGVDAMSKARSLAYRLDQVADWEVTTDKLGVSFGNHGGPNAPHTFRFICRSDLKDDVDDINAIEDFETGPQHERDVFMLTRHYMSSQHWTQVTAVLPACKSPPDVQPVGIRPKTAKDPKLERQIFAECDRAMRQNLITAEAREYLEAWVTGTLPSLERPSEYKFLWHRWDRQEERVARRVAVPYDGLSAAANHVRVRQAAPEPSAVPVADDLDDDQVSDLGDAAPLEALES